LIRISEVAAKEDSGRNAECIRMERCEMQKSRLRRTTDRGTDVGLDLPAGTILHDGDVVRGEGRTVMIRQIPETVAIIRPAGGPVPAEMWMLAAHAIGNMHRPVSVGRDEIIFPVQDASERETFTHMLDRVGVGRFEITVREAVFEPHVAADVAGHG
jgi:urease accessory protein